MDKPEDKKNEKVIPPIITAEGSLGLLALGAVGIKAWRQKREEERIKKQKTKE
jgi:hypothetical protein